MKTLTIALALLCATLTVFAQYPTCGAIKKNGEPCRMRVKVANERCVYHDSTATIRCGAIKKDGQPCRMPVGHPGERCRFHPAKVAAILPRRYDLI